jgi:hypothetical protein
MHTILVVGLAIVTMMVIGCQGRTPPPYGEGTSYTLESGVELNRQYPATFEIPSAVERESLISGQLAKLVFRITQGAAVNVERMWVIVQERHPGYYIGKLDNDPYSTNGIKSGMTVRFEPQHVIQIWQDK